MSYKKIGIITQVRGFEGEIFVEEIFSFEKYFRKNQKVLVGFSENFSKEYTLIKWKTGKRASVVRLSEIKDENSALNLKEQGIFIDESELIIKNKNPDLDKIEDEVIGCQVIDIDSNENIGKIIEVLYLPANDVWEIETSRGVLPIPVIDEVIKNIDLENKIVKIHILEGLWELIDNEKE